ncbi:hypothetical protein M1278_00540 [Candidatus Marsarchaeota archaeon]|nr:hypothetical protein [Candidatus Marsarchaeota archaeon]
MDNKKINKNSSTKNKNNSINKKTINLKEEIKEKFGLVILITLFLLIAALIIILFNFSKSNATQFNNCKNIILANFRNNCLMSLANATKNSSICNYVNSGDKNECFFNVAISKNSTETCKSINNSVMYSNCILNISIITQNETICNDLNNSYKYSCQYYFSKLNNFNNLNQCRSIANTSDRNICSNMFYYNQMLKTKNQNYCSNITNTANLSILNLMINNNIANNTKYKLFNISNSSSSAINLSNINKTILNTNNLNLELNNSEIIFGLVSNNVTPQNYCYFDSAIISKNLSTCNLAGNLGFICRTELNPQNSVNKTFNLTAEVNNCNKLSSYNLTSICQIGIYTSYALKTKNISICLKINNISERNICIINMAQQLNNSVYCNYINNTTIKSSCSQSFSLSDLSNAT